MKIYFYDRHGPDLESPTDQPKTEALRSLFQDIATSSGHTTHWVPTDRRGNLSYPDEKDPYLLIVHPATGGIYQQRMLHDQLLAVDEHAHLLLVSSSPQSLARCDHERAYASPVSYDLIEGQQIIALADSIEAGAPDWQTVAPGGDPGTLIAYYLLRVTGHLDALADVERQALEQAALAQLKVLRPDASLDDAGRHLGLDALPLSPSPHAQDSPT